ncbi:hypothetical protein BC829DRAFT_86543 [Chytridium lagenaria]|nr:hypothetical protein BC829DRAFT_86543 [Chytridium lagenaria]
MIVPDYVKALIRVLLSDKTLTPTPDDFTSPDGFTLWQKIIGGPLQQVIADLLSERHIDAPLRRAREADRLATEKKPPKPETKVTIFFKVIEARGLIAKEGRSRDAFCKIEHGAIAADYSPPWLHPRNQTRMWRLSRLMRYRPPLRRCGISI